MKAVDLLMSTPKAYGLVPETRAQVWAWWCEELKRRVGRLVPYILGKHPREWTKGGRR